MASVATAASRTVFEAIRPLTSRRTCTCLRSEATRPQLLRQQKRCLSTAPIQSLEMEVEAPATRPRWAQTPAAMKGSLTVKKMRSIGGRHDVNKDPKKVNEMYVRFLGPEGDQLLGEETRWQAITHKSFDHGRRGFNDRLAFLGKRIVELQASLNFLSYNASRGSLPELGDEGNAFSHPATHGIEILTQEVRSSFTHHTRVAKIARQCGLPEVARWVPRDPNNLSGSGADLVYAQAIYAIIGALALEQGSAVAHRVCKERLLEPLGLQQLGQQRSRRSDIEAPEQTEEMS